ncbi:hypothetical protein ACWGCW_31530 [Streptomyces sp. NPDC054933]
MSTPPAQAPSLQAQAQHTHHWVMSIQRPGTCGENLSGTWTSTIAPPPGSTRAEAYAEIRSGLMATVTGGKPPLVLHFSIKRNAL